MGETVPFCSLPSGSPCFMRWNERIIINRAWSHLIIGGHKTRHMTEPYRGMCTSLPTTIKMRTDNVWPRVLDNLGLVALSYFCIYYLYYYYYY